MPLRIRAVRLHVATADGTFGRTIEMADGMTIIRGANSRGKTQIVQAIIYCLGMERMLSARANQPLGSVLTSEILVPDSATERRAPVIESWVAVQFSNTEGTVVTAQRFVKSENYRPDLIRVWHGPAITDVAAAGDWSDYFTHQAGAATRERGFQTLLANLMGWDLPQVATFSGNLIPLYSDVMFPFLVVDQQAWSSAGPRKVERYQIQEPVQRAAEFLLNLSGPSSRADRVRLEAALAELRTGWAAARAGLTAAATSSGAHLDGVPERARAFVVHSGPEALTDLSEAQLVVVDGNEWASLASVVETLERQLAALTLARQPGARPDVSDRLTAELASARSELADIQSSTTLLDQDITLNEAQLAALDGRIATLTEELNRNKDVRTLVRLGSDVAAAHLADHNCPTCQQSLDAVEADHLGPTLDVEETVSLLNAQLNTTRKMRERVGGVVIQSSSTFAALQRQADQTQIRVQALEADVLAPANAPSEGDIASRLTLQLRIGELGRASDAFEEHLARLARIDEQALTVRNELNALPHGPSEQDTNRLEVVANQMRQRLEATRFDSYPIDQIRIDPDALRPGRLGFDIDVDVSASDVIRVKVAYLDAIRSVGVEFGNHPGILVLDEPRQQDLDADDFYAMLRYLARGSGPDAQVIVTSATPIEELDSNLGDVPVTIIDLGESRLIVALGSPDPLDSL